MRTVPTRIKRWLETQHGEKFILLRRSTLRAIIRLFDYTAQWLPTVTDGPTQAESVDVQATLAHLRVEVDELRRVLEKAHGDGPHGSGNARE